MKRKFTWRKDPFDKRDYLHKRIEKIPNVVNLISHMPPVRDQGYVGSCVGFAVGANLTAWAKKQNVFTEWLSPTWIYNGARYIEGSLPYDDGCYPRDAYEWLRTKGGLLEHFWPYDGNKVDPTPPPSKFDVEASKYPVTTYYRVTGGVDGICSALASGYPVTLGAAWFDLWMDPGDKGILSFVTSSDSVAGGHETIIYGYDLSLKVFYGMNSWGALWGEAGFYTMHFSSFDAFTPTGGYDAHYINVSWGSTPNPPAPPEPTPTTSSISITIVDNPNYIVSMDGIAQTPSHYSPMEASEHAINLKFKNPKAIINIFNYGRWVVSTK